jgi:hypothetical protein
VTFWKRGRTKASVKRRTSTTVSYVATARCRHLSRRAAATMMLTKKQKRRGKQRRGKEPPNKKPPSCPRFRRERWWLRLTWTMLTKRQCRPTATSCLWRGLCRRGGCHHQSHPRAPPTWTLLLDARRQLRVCGGGLLGLCRHLDVTTKTTPVARGGVISATYLDYTYGVAVSPDGNYVL